MKCPLLEERKRRASDTIASMIADRQYFDIRHLRFKDADGPEMGEVIAEMAEHIVNAIERTKTFVLEVNRRLESAGANRIPPSLGGTLHADERLNTRIRFGGTLPEIADAFKQRMDEFNAIDGMPTRDKYLDLASHVYACVALDLESYLTPTNVSAENRRFASETSSRLKRLAHAS